MNTSDANLSGDVGLSSSIFTGDELASDARDVIRVGLSMICAARPVYPIWYFFPRRRVLGSEFPAFSNTNEMRPINDWIDKGVFFGLRHKILRQVSLMFISSNGHMLHEEFVFTVKYSEVSGVPQILIENHSRVPFLRMGSNNNSELYHVSVSTINTTTTSSQNKSNSCSGINLNEGDSDEEEEAEEGATATTEDNNADGTLNDTQNSSSDTNNNNIHQMRRSYIVAARKQLAHLCGEISFLCRSLPHRDDDIIVRMRLAYYDDKLRAMPPSFCFCPDGFQAPDARDRELLRQSSNASAVIPFDSEVELAGGKTNVSLEMRSTAFLSAPLPFHVEQNEQQGADTDGNSMDDDQDDDEEEGEDHHRDAAGKDHKNNYNNKNTNQSNNNKSGKAPRRSVRDFLEECRKSEHRTKRLAPKERWLVGMTVFLLRSERFDPKTTVIDALFFEAQLRRLYAFDKNVCGRSGEITATLLAQLRAADIIDLHSQLVLRNASNRALGRDLLRHRAETKFPAIEYDDDDFKNITLFPMPDLSAEVIDAKIAEQRRREREE